MSARHRLALTSLLAVSMLILTPPMPVTSTPWAVSTAHAVPPGATPPGDLSMSASLDRLGTVQVKGALRTQNGQPVSGALINLAVDGKPFTAGVTHGDGSWSSTLRLPPGMQAGSHELSATFDGIEGVGAASASGSFSIAPLPTGISVAVKPMATTPGTLLNVHGQVILSNHRPVTDGQVAIVLGTDGQAALTTPTDSQGYYQAAIQVPLYAPSGPLTVTVKLLDSRYGVSQRTSTVQVKSASPSPTPTPTPTTVTPTTPTPPTATNDGVGSPDGRIPTTSSRPAPAAHLSVLDSFGGRKPVLILAGVVGVLLLGVLLGSVTRRRGGKSRSGDEGDGNSLFDDWGGPDQR